MRRRRNIQSSELGIDLHSLRERELFRWFLSCLLFGKPIQQEIARNAFLQLDQAGLNSPQAVLNAGWDSLVDLLDRAHYVRYDFSTASKLLDVCKALMLRYGALKHVIQDSATPAQLAKTLQEFKGIGPVTAGIFMREIRPIWNALKLEETKRIGRQTMNQKPGQTSSKWPPVRKRRVTPKAVALPKGAKEVLHKGAKGKIVPLSPSQPHSKSFGR
jgi:hypothetical protein